MASLMDIDVKALPSFKGQTALITGGSSGIGLSTSLLFSSLGANVVIADISPPPPGSTPNSILFVKTDATSYASLLALFRATERHFGSWPGIVFANAGIGERGDVFHGDDDIETEPKHEVLDLDLKAVANTVRLAMYGMRKNGKEGSVIMTASLAGYTGQPGLQMYNAAKHGVVGLLRALRHTAPRDKVAVSLVAPAITATAILSTATDHFDEAVKGLKAAGVPVNTPERIAETVVWLAAQGPKANGMGLLVQAGQVTDLERGVAKSRKHWMGEEMARVYQSGTGYNVFEKIAEKGGMGTGGSKL